MTITFNGRVFAGFVVGVLVGVGVAALSARHVYADQAQAKEVAIRRAFYEDFGVKGDVQPALDKMDIWTLFSEAGKEFQVRANVIQQLSARQGAEAPVAATAQSTDDRVFSTLNKVYPGLGTASKIAKTLLDQHQASAVASDPYKGQPAPKCSTGQVPSRFPNQPWTCQDLPVATMASNSPCVGSDVMIHGGCRANPCESGKLPVEMNDGSVACFASEVVNQ